jgi:hypothetical protein
MGPGNHSLLEHELVHGIRLHSQLLLPAAAVRHLEIQVAILDGGVAWDLPDEVASSGVPREHPEELELLLDVEGVGLIVPEELFEVQRRISIRTPRRPLPHLLNIDPHVGQRAPTI